MSLALGPMARDIEVWSGAAARPRFASSLKSPGPAGAGPCRSSCNGPGGSAAGDPVVPPARPTVRTKAVRGGERLRVDVNPHRAADDCVVKIQKQKAVRGQATTRVRARGQGCRHGQPAQGPVPCPGAGAVRNGQTDEQGSQDPPLIGRCFMRWL